MVIPRCRIVRKFIAPRSPLAFGLGVRQTKRIWFRHTALSRFGKCRKRGDCPDAARAAHPSLVLHRELGTPPRASAHDRTAVSALPGSWPRHASHRRRPRQAGFTCLLFAAWLANAQSAAGLRAYFPVTPRGLRIFYPTCPHDGSIGMTVP